MVSTDDILSALRPFAIEAAKWSPDAGEAPILDEGSNTLFYVKDLQLAASVYKTLSLRQRVEDASDG